MPSPPQIPVRIAMIGAGSVSDYHHMPGIRLDPRATLAAVCDANPRLVRERAEQWQVERFSQDYREICASDAIDAVIIATPNNVHLPIALEAIKHGKHVMCEKPLGLSVPQAKEMYLAACRAGVVHMTAFTYRFAPSLKYMHALIQNGELGEIRHFRSQRFLDWPETSWGWQQYKDRAGAGNLFDMTIHRIDLGLWLVGPLVDISGATQRFAVRDRTSDGRNCRPSEVDDWSSLIGRFENGAVGVWESTNVAKGYNRGGYGHDWIEVNGSKGSAAYQLFRPNEIFLGKAGGDVVARPVPQSFLVPPGSPRNPDEGAPATVFRYDLTWEFVSAILENRDASPSFYDGLSAQIIADAVLESEQERRWISVKMPDRGVDTEG